jgi:hypothetical protein
MAARVDQLLALRWAAEGVQPAPGSTDAEFLRRASLDLTGVIPSVQEARSFLNGRGESKRATLIESLLARPSHATHLANIWRDVLLPGDFNQQQFGGSFGFESWLRGQFADNVPYDKLVNSLLVATGAANEVGPALFYTALRLQPEELAAATSRVFLGVQIQCAQCHNHPHDHWTQDDFWGYAAFFARLQRPGNQPQFAFQVTEGDSGEVTLPGSNQAVTPKFLGSRTSPDDEGLRRRLRLAIWLTARDNPYFAKAAVNRVWAMLFGRGIVDPVDDLGGHNPPSHPALLDDLAAYFVQTGFDLRRLFRTLCQTQAYQLSSQAGDETQQYRPDLYHRMAIKTLSADQLYDCLLEAMRRRELSSQQPFGQPGRAFDPTRQAFLAKFRAPTQGATQYDAGIPQALSLMNGALMTQATSVATSDLLIALDAPFLTDDDRLDVLFLSTVSRYPTTGERGPFLSHLQRASDNNERRKALGDVLWALLNSAEFVLNH